MKHEPIVQSRRRATNITLSEPLVERARALGVGISQACEIGLSAAVTEASARLWKKENAAWSAAHRQWVEANELPLERYRLF